MVLTKGPPPGQEDGPLECQLLAGVDYSKSAPKTASAQANPLRTPRLERAAILTFPRPPRRISVRISAADGRVPIGRTRPLRLRESDLAWLIETAERM
jgi:hypothetical protein